MSVMVMLQQHYRPTGPTVAVPLLGGIAKCPSTTNPSQPHVVVVVVAIPVETVSAVVVLEEGDLHGCYCGCCFSLVMMKLVAVVAVLERTSAFLRRHPRLDDYFQRTESESSL